MSEWRSVIILGCVTAYMVVCLGVGLWALRRTKNTQDFFMAGRHRGQRGRFFQHDEWLGICGWTGVGLQDGHQFVLDDRLYVDRHLHHVFLAG